MSGRNQGRIITFYSYKGGTGRSMTLANVGWILASRWNRVLLIDWDLEAPGLHRYFHPFLEDKGLTTSDGLIEFFMRFEEAASGPPSNANAQEASKTDNNWYLPLADPSKFILPLAWPFEHGTLDLLPAGKQGPSYAARVNSFNWAAFYERLGGGVFVEAMKQKLREQYDYILVDSRTGVSDTAGICTVQMPDDVVVCFTYNTQSIEGAAAVASAIRSQRESDANRVPPAFKIFPVPMRVERAEHDRLNRARDFGRDAFAGFIDHITMSRRSEYWGEIEVPYVPYYAYQEILATIAEPPGLRDSFARSCERVVDFVTTADSRKQQVLPEARREEIKQLFLRGAESGGVRVALARYPELQAFSDELVTQQKAWYESQSKQDKYLLQPPALERLRSRSELLIALLEDRDFRAFFEASERQVASGAKLVAFRRNITILAGVTVLLIGLGFVRLKGFLSFTLWKHLEFVAAGMCGAAWYAVYRFYSSGSLLRVTDWRVESTRRVTLRLFMGAFAGLMAATVIDSGLVGVMFNTDLGPSLGEYIRTLVLPFLAGAAAHTLVSDLAQTIDIVFEKDTR